MMTYSSHMSCVRILIGCWLIYEVTSTKNEFGQNNKKPQQIKIEIVNSTSIRLTWKHPKTDANCPITNYIIRVKSSDLDPSAPRTWKFDASHTSAMVNDLKPNTEYLVRVAAEHCDGKDKSSKWMSTRTSVKEASGRKDGGGLVERESNPAESSSVQGLKDLHAPGQPTNVRTRPGFDSMFVSWNSPEGGATVRGFMIGYGEGVPDVNWQYLEPHRRNVTIQHLKRLTQYVISVRAFNDYDQGPVVYDLVYTTDRSGPSSVGAGIALARPNQIRTKVFSQTSIRLQWIDPSLGRSQKITDNRYYNVHYEEAAGTTAGKTLSIIVKDLSVVLENLLPGTRYEFKIRTILDGQMSLFSEIVSSKTHTADFVGGAVFTLPPNTREEKSKSVVDHTADSDQHVKTSSTMTSSYITPSNTTSSNMTMLRHPTSLESGSLVKDSMDGKSKRGSVMRDVYSPTNGSGRSDTGSPARSTVEKDDMGISFHSIVVHRILAYVTWSEVPSRSRSCSDRPGSKVIGYRFRYRIVNDEGDDQYIMHTLTDNSILLENLLPESSYIYQVKYLMMEGDKETPWSLPGNVHTRYYANDGEQ